MSTELEIYVTKAYPKIREDRPNKQGTTPTKLKVPLIDVVFDRLDKLHPAFDIPYSYAFQIAAMYVGKPVLFEHQGTSIGTIRDCHVTSNPDHVLKMSKKRNFTWNGKPIKYHTLIATVSIVKSIIEKLIKENHIMKITDMDVSIAYDFEFEIDDEDIVYEIDKETKEPMLDWEKTMIYAHNYHPNEISLCDRGSGAVPGAKVFQKLSETQQKGRLRIGPRLKQCLLKRTHKLSKNAKSRHDKLLKIALSRFSLLRPVNWNARLELKENLKYRESKRQSFKKKETTKMSETEADTVPEPDKDVDMKETPDVEETPAEPENEQAIDIDAEFLRYTQSHGIVGEEGYKNLGKEYMKIKFQHQKEYSKKKTTEVDGDCDKFIDCLKTAKYGKEIDKESLKAQMGPVYSNMENEELVEGLQKILVSFLELTKKIDNPSPKTKQQPRTLPKVDFSETRTVASFSQGEANKPSDDLRMGNNILDMLNTNMQFSKHTNVKRQLNEYFKKVKETNV